MVAEARYLARILCLALLVAIATACESGGDSFCEGASYLSVTGTCDIREESCQQSVLDAVECVRGPQGYQGDVRVIDEDAYAEEVDEWFGLGVDDEAEDSPYDPWDEALRLFLFIPPESSQEEADAARWAESVAAYYDGEYRDITIVDRGNDFDAVSDMYTLAHEYVHALQDHDFGLSELRGRYSYDDDTLIALNNLTEGEANLHAQLAVSVLRGYQPIPDSLEKYFDFQTAHLRREIVSADSPYSVAKGSLHYGTGGAYLADAYLAGGRPAVEAVLADPPLTSVRWMAGYEADHADDTDWEQAIDCDAFEPPRGYTFWHSDTLGAVLLFAFLGSERQAMRYDVARAWQLALEWRGEEFRVFEGEGEQTAVLWHLRLGKKEVAEQLADLVEARGTPWRVERHGREVRVFAASDPSILDDWTKRSRCKNKRPDDGG